MDVHPSTMRDKEHQEIGTTLKYESTTHFSRLSTHTRSGLRRGSFQPASRCSHQVEPQQHASEHGQILASILVAVRPEEQIIFLDVEVFAVAQSWSSPSSLLDLLELLELLELNSADANMLVFWLPC